MVGLTEVGNLDPPQASTPSALTLLRTACDGLVAVDHGTGEPRPALARSWQVAEGARTVTVDLRPNMTFQDGSPLNSGAVREALSRLARPANSSPWSGLVSRIEGFSEVQEGSATHLSGVRSLADLTLQIRLVEPFSDFPTLLAHPSLIPVSPESLREGVPESTYPVCSGPYRIEDGLEPGDLRLVRSREGIGHNEAFLEAGRGLAERILVRAFPNLEDAYDAYGAGGVDMAAVPDSRLAEAQLTRAGYATGATPQISYLAFDISRPETSDPRLRQAISLALDRLRAIDAAYGDGRRPATRWLPEGYGPPGESTCDLHARRIADPQQARQLLQSVQVPGRLILFHDPQVAGRLAVEALSIQVQQELGIVLDPRPLEGRDAQTAFRDRGPEAAVWVMANQVDLPLPEQLLGELFETGSPANVLGFADPEFDAAARAARSATERADVERLYVEAENALCARMPAIPLWTTVSHWMIHPDRVEIEGDRAFGFMGGPLLRHMRAPGSAS